MCFNGTFTWGNAPLTLPADPKHKICYTSHLGKDTIVLTEQCLKGDVSISEETLCIFLDLELPSKKCYMIGTQ